MKTSAIRASFLGTKSRPLHVGLGGIGFDTERLLRRLHMPPMKKPYSDGKV